MMERTHPMRLSRNRWLALLVIASLALLAVKPASSLAGAEKKPKQKYEGEQIFRGLLFGEEGPISKMFPEIWDRPDVKQQMNSAAKLRAWNALKEKAVKSIRKKDPDFFNRFGREIQSGDHLRIQQMMAESGRLITETIGTNGHAKADGQGSAKVVPASMSGDAGGAAAQEQAVTTCGDGICVTEDANGIYIDDDPTWTGEAQDATALACSAVAVCALAIALAVWKYAVAVDVAAVAYVAAVVVAIWKWKYKYSYSYAELDAEQTLYQEMIVNSIAEQLDASPQEAYEE